MELKEDTNTRGIVYCLYDGINDVTKIGRTKNENTKRQKAQLAYSANKIIHFSDVWVDNYTEVEKACHKRFSDNRLNGEWFRIRPDVILSYIIENHSYHKMEMISYSALLNYMNLCLDIKGNIPFRKP